MWEIIWLKCHRISFRYNLGRVLITLSDRWWSVVVVGRISELLINQHMAFYSSIIVEFHRRIFHRRRILNCNKLETLYKDLQYNRAYDREQLNFTLTAVRSKLNCSLLSLFWIHFKACLYNFTQFQYNNSPMKFNYGRRISSSNYFESSQMSQTKAIF